jgi:hypothetical protein
MEILELLDAQHKTTAKRKRVAITSGFISAPHYAKSWSPVDAAAQQLVSFNKFL